MPNRVSQRRSTFKGGTEALDADQGNDATGALGLAIEASTIKVAKEAWRRFLAEFPTRQEAADAVFESAFESMPSLQYLFTSVQGVLAFRFLASLDALVAAMDDPQELRRLTDRLAFLHMSFNIKLATVMVFRDAVIEVLERMLDNDDFPLEAREGLCTLMDYVGEGFREMSATSGNHLQVVHDSWKLVHDKAAENMLEASASGGSSSSNEDGEDLLHGLGEGGEKMQLPTTFAEMFDINAAMMGFAGNKWMTEVLESMDVVVSNIMNIARVREETSVLALRLATEAEQVEFSEFKACMMAALRSLLLQHWTSTHEVAWGWVLVNIEQLLADSFVEPPVKLEKALSGFLESLDPEASKDMRRAIYANFFEHAPAGQDYFKQSDSRLHFIQEHIISMTMEIYKQPKRFIKELSALGLRHVSYGIPLHLFSPFVTASVQVLCSLTEDCSVHEAYRWSLNLIAKILVRVIREGSTVVMKAINSNSTLQLKKALSSAPRSERATQLLDVQVGGECISPLFVAIHTGSLEVADAIIKDLLTIRADRDRYYYGVDELFKRHRDIVKVVCEEAMMLLPTLLDGLIWRSHRQVQGLRRVNYYIHHLLANEDRSFASNVKWLTATGNPAAISHPTIVVVSDTLWNGLVYRQFIFDKLWDVLSLSLFMLAQSFLPGLIKDEELESVTLGYTIFVTRILAYIVGIGRLISQFFTRAWLWSRAELKRIFEEIDTDGNGQIDWAEVLEASQAFKESVKTQIAAAMQFLKDDQNLHSMDQARKTIAGNSKTLSTLAAVALMLLLTVMCILEPYFWCVGDNNWPTSQCPKVSQDMRNRYAIVAMSGLVIHWFTLVDLAVFSTKISAFILVCSHVLTDVVQFLTALGFLLLLFGSAISIMCDSCPLNSGDFSSMDRAVVTLFAITLGFYEGDWRGLQESPLLLAMVLLFITCSGVILMNLLIAQLALSYEFVYQDMLGWARLNRALLIVEVMRSCRSYKWQKFLDSLGFDQRIEFDEGDLGLHGGIQVLESAKAKLVTEEAICRYGGSTSPDDPWPVDKVHEESNEVQMRIGKLMQQALKEVSKLNPPEKKRTSKTFTPQEGATFLSVISN
mmetsp:Transcript_27357/g.63821  ORF Transcript_27357/g.63821 Transcript_27357/m.63821 type:complete len:1095 (+) Transcript_27357:192-3476(+)